MDIGDRRWAAVLLTAVGILTGCGSKAGPAVAPGATVTRPADPGGSARAIDPCTVFTDAEVRTMIGSGAPRREPGGTSRSVCTVTGTGSDLSIRVSLFGDPDTAPDVFNDQKRFGQEPQLVLGVGRAAFTVVRRDEVGLVVLTDRTVLSTSVISARGTLTDPGGTLRRITPVVKSAAGRL